MNSFKDVLKSDHATNRKFVSATSKGCRPHLDDALRGELMQLPDPERLVLILHDVVEMNVQEVAQEMAISAYRASRYHDSGWGRLRNGLRCAGVRNAEHVQGDDLQFAVCDAGAVPEGLMERVMKKLTLLPLLA